jgi:hypothetical protein
MGKLCFTFGWNHEWRAGPPSVSWLGETDLSINPGCGMEGQVYVTDVPPSLTDRIETTCAQDMEFVRKLLQLSGTTDTYTVGWFNCQRFSRRMFDDAQQRYGGQR